MIDMLSLEPSKGMCSANLLVTNISIGTTAAVGLNADDCQVN